MLKINPDDGGTLDEEHTKLILAYQNSSGSVSIERLQEQLRQCARPATVSTDETPPPEPQSPSCCGR